MSPKFNEFLTDGTAQLFDRQALTADLAANDARIKGDPKSRKKMTAESLRLQEKADKCRQAAQILEDSGIDLPELTKEEFEESFRILFPTSLTNQIDAQELTQEVKSLLSIQNEPEVVETSIKIHGKKRVEKVEEKQSPVAKLDYAGEVVYFPSLSYRLAKAIEQLVINAQTQPGMKVSTQKLVAGAFKNGNETQVTQNEASAMHMALYHLRKITLKDKAPHIRNAIKSKTSGILFEVQSGFDNPTFTWLKDPSTIEPRKISTSKRTKIS